MTPTDKSARCERRGAKQAHDDAFTGAGVAMDEREAALAQMRLLDAPTEVLDLGRHIERLGRHVGGKGVPFEAIEGQEFLVHVGSSFSVVGK